KKILKNSRTASLAKEVPHTFPKSEIGEALIYASNQWTTLVRHVENAARSAGIRGTGPLPDRVRPDYWRKNEKKSGAPTRGHGANVSMMNSPGPGWAYKPWKTTWPCETRVR